MGEVAAAVVAKPLHLTVGIQLVMWHKSPILRRLEQVPRKPFLAQWMALLGQNHNDGGPEPESDFEVLETLERALEINAQTRHIGWPRK